VLADGLQMPLERHFGRGIGLLAFDAPVAQLLQADRPAGYGAAHEIALLQHLVVGVAEAQLGLAAAGRVSGPGPESGTR